MSDGLYCLIPPKEDVKVKYNVTNAALLSEDLIGRCVHEITSNEESGLHTWFNYMFNVRRACFGEKHYEGDMEQNHTVTKQMATKCALE